MAQTYVTTPDLGLAGMAQEATARAEAYRKASAMLAGAGRAAGGAAAAGAANAVGKFVKTRKLDFRNRGSEPHARIASGPRSLPSGMAIDIEALAEISVDQGAPKAP